MRDVDALEAQIAELRARVELLEARSGGLRDADDARVVIALASAGVTTFTAAGVLQHAAVAPELQRALAAADCDSSARSLGRLLRRVEHRAIDGVVIRRAERAVHGVRRWTLTRDVSM